MLGPLDDGSDQRITHSVPAQVRPDPHRHQLSATAGGINNGGNQAAACTRLVKPQQGDAGAEPAPPVIDAACVFTLQRRAESSRRVRQGSNAQVAEKRLVTRLTETQPHGAEASVGCPQLAAVPPGTALPGRPVGHLSGAPSRMSRWGSPSGSVRARVPLDALPRLPSDRIDESAAPQKSYEYRYPE